MHEIGLILAAAFVFAYTLVARRLAQTPVTAPLLCLAFGYFLHEVGLLSISGIEPMLHLIGEATLVLVLFSDAASIDLSRLRKAASKPARLLIFGLPFTIAIGILVQLFLLPGWPIWEIALLAAILAPTDAALGQQIVTSEDVPLEVRQTLSTESGLNDGLALPAILFFACFAVDGAHDEIQTTWWQFALQQIGLGSLLGVLIGGSGAIAMKFAADRNWSNQPSEGVAVLSLAAMSYFLAHALGGNSFLCAFVAGLTFGHLMQQRCRFVFEFVETDGQFLIMMVFLMMGASLLPDSLRLLEANWVLLIVFSLAAVRPIAVLIAMIGTRSDFKERLFYGWFGPRGIATALFALMVVETFDGLTHGHEILAIATLTVAASAVLHGVTAAPATRLWRAPD